MKLSPAATTRHVAPLVARTAAVALTASLSACTIVGGLFSNDKTDYKTTANSAKPLEVPPDLTQLARESRYQPQGGVISASGVGQPQAPGAAAVAAAGGVVVAPKIQGAIRVEREGQLRWLVTPQAPEQVWPLLRAFWEQRGYKLTQENPQTGVMETDWTEDRTKLPNDFIRSTLGKVLGNIYDSGERDLYRTRVERTAGGSEIYVSHRGMEEVYVGERKESTTWRPRPPNPDLEAEMLAKLMVALGSPAEPAKTAVAGASEPPSKARPSAAGASAASGAAPAVVQQATSLVVDDTFDRAWRRVGLALDRGGFTVEDRDRAAGLYYVRYIDPKYAGQDEPGFWAKLFGDKTNPQAALRYRILLKPTGEKTNLSVQTSTGAPDTGDNAKRIVGLLINELK